MWFNKYRDVFLVPDELDCGFMNISLVEELFPSVPTIAVDGHHRRQMQVWLPPMLLIRDSADPSRDPTTAELHSDAVRFHGLLEPPASSPPKFRLKRSSSDDAMNMLPQDTMATQTMRSLPPACSSWTIPGRPRIAWHKGGCEQPVYEIHQTGADVTPGNTYDVVDNAPVPLNGVEANPTEPYDYAFETEIPSWEAQLFEELVESGVLDNAAATATTPATFYATTSSPPPTSDLCVATNPADATQPRARSKTRLSQSQEALQAFRAKLLSIWTEHTGCTTPTKHDKPQPLLHAAARLGNCEMMQMLLDHGADINARDIEGRTPLLAAVEAYKGDAIIFLLEAGVDVNAHDEQGRTALSMAVEFDCENAVDLFLRHGADPNLAGSDLLRSTHSGFLEWIASH
ncbi:conserved hypothetical protein [Verticillium alfalfae VaMs.102]|uniref:Uncharacterized protein n=1 Tax=Verticillium alfalfae (strain VaMs.102 / ATCC MYA-4576 / FGSC 10136) TaxID=526221 RepID=C9SIV6_VERA1|nr:conserved hypothetical protein [Verticillium alfalfae VaMs.102]EEY18879.1 conserved hypothetical protein [Verticillium alfalfae VaMs.102]